MTFRIPATLALAALVLPAAAYATLLQATDEAAAPNAATLEDPVYSDPVKVSDLFMIEPSVRVDSTGVIYVGAARGLPSASPVYRSEDGGETWTRLPRPPGTVGVVSFGVDTVGAEPELALAEDDTLYVSELTVANTIIYKYVDHGRTLSGVSLIAQTSTGVDRQWITMGEPNAAGGHEMWLNTNDVGRGVYQYYTPDAVLVPATKPKAVSGIGGSPSFPPVYSRATGYTYTPISMNGDIWIGRSSSDPVDLATVAMPKWRIAQTGDSANQFPVAAVDDAGNVYAAWSQPSDGGNWDVYYAASTNHGVTWTPPVKLSQGGLNVYPWMDAGSDGRIAVVWYHSDGTGNPETQQGPWRVQVAQTLGAETGIPQVKLATIPHVVQEGYGICLSGTGCSLSASGSRALGDYFQVAIGPDGMIHIAYAAAVDGTATRVYHVKQVGGTPS